MSELMLMIVSIFGMMLIPVIAMIINSMRCAARENRKSGEHRTAPTSDRTEVERTEFMTRGNIRLSLGMVDGDSAEKSKYDEDLAELIP